MKSLEQVRDELADDIKSRYLDKPPEIYNLIWDITRIAFDACLAHLAKAGPEYGEIITKECLRRELVNLQISKKITHEQLDDLHKLDKELSPYDMFQVFMDQLEHLNKLITARDWKLNNRTEQVYDQMERIDELEQQLAAKDEEIERLKNELQFTGEICDKSQILTEEMIYERNSALTTITTQQTLLEECLAWFNVPCVGSAEKLKERIVQHLKSAKGGG